jgi:sulfite reductase (NADPH) flavoprotein alpha-component
MSKKLAVLFGSETGNSEGLAEAFAEEAKGKGFEVDFGPLSAKKPEELKALDTLITVISTWGEGDPPADAEKFCDKFFTTPDGEVDLTGLKHHILALGDKSYDDFCGCGRRLDGHLERLGSAQFKERTELDTDFDDHFDKWKNEVFAALS